MTAGRRYCSVLALVGALALAAGCGDDDDSSSGSAGAAATSAATSAASAASTTAAAPTKKPLNIGYVAYTLAAPPQQDMKKGAEQAAAKSGDSIKTVDAQADNGKANSLMQTFVTQKVDAIIVDSFSADTLRAGLQAAKEAKIPVYLAYAPTDDPSLAAAVQANAGTETANKLVEDLGDSGSVLAFTLPPGPNCVSSEKQFDEVMAAHSGWKVRKQPVKVPGWEQDAATTTSGWLKSHPKGEKLAVWSCWDGPGIGAASALNAAGRTDVNLYGQNLEAKSADLLEKKRYTLSYYFDSVGIGAHMVELADANSGVAYDAIQHKFERFKGEPVDQANVAEFVKQHPQVVG